MSYEPTSTIVEYDTEESQAATIPSPSLQPENDEVQADELRRVPQGHPKSKAEAIPRRFRDRYPHGIDWWVTGWMTTVHVAAVAALWFFTWQAFVLFLFLHWVSACLGVTLGYHRLLTHGSLIVPRPLKYFFSLCGMVSAEGSPLMWVAIHRKHHVLSDLPGDPHSPNEGFWWSHMMWFHPKEDPVEVDALFKRWAPDIYKDPVQQFFHKTYMIYPIIFGGILYAIGEYFLQAGMSFLLWGLFARMAVCYHSTWFVNSATHIWGYRNYETNDRSRNLWWVALVSYGEGWHNNHHAHQRLARHGHRWWELDVTYMTIWTLKKLGLATDVQDTLPENSSNAAG